MPNSFLNKYVKFSVRILAAFFWMFFMMTIYPSPNHLIEYIFAFVIGGVGLLLIAFLLDKILDRDVNVRK